MRFDNPLDDALRTRAHVRVLRALFGVPTGLGRSARDLARRAGVSHPTALGALASLADQGLVTVRSAAHANSYTLNMDHRLVQQLRPLFEWEYGVREKLVTLLRDELSRHPDVRAAHLFGSVARGDAGPRSDVDVAVVTRAKAEDRLEALTSSLEDVLRSRYGNQLSVIYLREPPGPKHLWETILREGVPIVERPKRPGRRHA